MALAVGVPLIHMSHKQVDRQRFREDRAEERFFLPNPGSDQKPFRWVNKRWCPIFFGFGQF